MKKTLSAIIIMALIPTLLSMSGCSNKTGETSSQEVLEHSSQKYQEAMDLCDKGELEQALEAFKQVDQQDQSHYPLAQSKINELKELLFEMYVNKAKEHYTAEEYHLAVSSLETALDYRNSQPVRELLEHYKNAPAGNEDSFDSIEEIQQAKKQMQSYEGGTGNLKISLDNIYTREFSIGNVQVEVSDDIVFLKLWVSIINEGTKNITVKPENIKLFTSDNRAYTYHPEYTKQDDIPFVEILLPPKGRASGKLLILIPLEKSYRFEYNDGVNRVVKNVIPY